MSVPPSWKIVGSPGEKLSVFFLFLLLLLRIPGQMTCQWSFDMRDPPPVTPTTKKERFHQGSDKME